VLELVEEGAEREAGVHCGDGQGVGGGEVCVDDVDLEGGEGWEVVELGGHDGRVEGWWGEARGDWCMLTNWRAKVVGRAEKVAEWQSGRVTK
jgi:hypothetical protein